MRAAWRGQRASSSSSAGISFVLTALALWLAAGFGLVGCDGGDEAAPPSSGGAPERSPLGASALASTTGEPASELPAQVLVLSSSSRLQRVELAGESPSAAAPVQIPGRVLLATSDGSALCLVVDTGRDLELEHRSVADPGAAAQRVPLDASAERPPTVLYSHGSGCIVGLARELRFVDFGSRPRPYQMAILELPLGRPVQGLAALGDALWAFDDQSAPHLVHEFRISRELPRFIASWTPPSAIAGRIRDAARDGDEILVVAGEPGQDAVVALRAGCRPEGERHCVLWRRESASAGDGAIEGLLPGRDGLLLRAGARGLLAAARPPATALSDAPTPLPEPVALEPAALGGDAEQLAPVRDMRRYGGALLVLRGAQGSAAELVHARLDAEGELEIVSRTALPADAQRILGTTAASTAGR